MIRGLNNPLLSYSINIVLSVAARAFGILSLFLCNLVIARHFGPDGLGYFQICYSTILIASTAGRLGLDQLGLRKAAGTGQNGSEALSRWMGASLQAAGTGLSLAIMILLLVYGLGFWPRNTQQSSLSYPLFMLAILPTGLLGLLAETMRGRQLIKLAIFLQSALGQGLFLISLLIACTLFAAGWTIIALLYGLSIACALACAAWAWRNHLSPISMMHDPSAAIANAKAASGLWASTLLAAMAASIDVLVLGFIAPPDVVGRYSAIIRTGALVGTFIQVSTAAYVPIAAADFAHGRIDKFLKSAWRWSAAFALGAIPAAIALYIWRDLFGLLWGAGFKDQSNLLVVYGVAQLLQATVAISGLLLPVMYVDRALVLLAALGLLLRAVGTGLGFAFGGLAGAVWGMSAALLAGNIAALIVFFFAIAARRKSLAA